ncbi:MAG: inorganic phosphate transporter [Anaerolineae bacterium]|nr:MAG: inorganic phosphate transporter [Anaerolineae bacterium]
MIIILLILAVFFDFLNGMHDSSNIVATVISSRAANPRVALMLAAVAEFLGPFLFGVAVATTIGDDLLVAETITQTVIVAALAAAIIWNLLTWYFGIPSSSSHALVGGLLGASILAAGVGVIKIDGLVKIVLALLLSPPLGLLTAFLIMRITLWAVRNSTPNVNTGFRRLQIPTLVGLALSHGTNDAQKTMGVIALGLLTAGFIDSFFIPIWVIFISALAIALGTALGGWRLIRTLGGKIYKVRPIHGFTSQIAGAAVILSASFLGGPVSTTQVMSSAIVGAGAGERVNKVRWNVLRDMVYAWALTIPTTAIIAGIAYLVLDQIVP